MKLLRKIFKHSKKPIEKLDCYNCNGTGNMALGKREVYRFCPICKGTGKL